MSDLSSAVPDAGALAVGGQGAQDPTLCAACDVRLEREYYSVNGRRVCTRCRGRLRGSMGLGVVLGGLAASASVGLYYGVWRLLDMRFLLVAVLAGVAIGAAVRKGAGYGGARLNRPVALVLTYITVTTTYVHSVLELGQGHSLANAWVASLALPARMILEGKNLVSIALLAFGLHEAWQFSRPPVVNEEGPHRLDDPQLDVSAAAAAVGGAGHGAGSAGSK